MKRISIYFLLALLLVCWLRPPAYAEIRKNSGEKTKQNQNQEPGRNPEEETDWEKRLRDVQLTGDLRTDLAALAKSQVGYRESARDYAVDKSGEKMGYTIYGDYFKSPYAKWCAMFAAYIYRHAGADEQSMPTATSAQQWVALLKKTDSDVDADGQYSARYHTAKEARDGDYTVRMGDLVIFNPNKDKKADHVGIVVDTETKEDALGIRQVTGFQVVEGNYADSVRETSYSITDKDIMGFGELRIALDLTLEDSSENPSEPQTEKPAPSEQVESESESAVMEAVGSETEKTPEAAIAPQIEGIEPDASRIHPGFVAPYIGMPFFLLIVMLQHFRRKAKLS